MGETLAEAVRNALRAVTDPATGRDVVSSGMVEGLTAKAGLVQFALAVPREEPRRVHVLADVLLALVRPFEIRRAVERGE